MGFLIPLALSLPLLATSRLTWLAVAVLVQGTIANAASFVLVAYYTACDFLELTIWPRPDPVPAG